MEKALTYILAALTRHAAVQKVILFGSRARGDADERSDIDIAVACPDIDKRAWLQLVDDISEINTLLKIDLVNYTECDSALKNNIDHEGVALYERNTN